MHNKKIAFIAFMSAAVCFFIAAVCEYLDGNGGMISKLGLGICYLFLALAFYPKRNKDDRDNEKEENNHGRAV